MIQQLNWCCIFHEANNVSERAKRFQEHNDRNKFQWGQIVMALFAQDSPREGARFEARWYTAVITGCREDTYSSLR